MKKMYHLIGLLLMIFSLAACAGTDEETVTVEEPETETEAGAPVEETDEVEEFEEFKPLTNQEIEKIVINNLDQMDASQDAYDYQETMGIVNDAILEPELDTEEVTEILEATKEKFQRLVADEILDEWTRDYLATFYWTMSRQHLHSHDINTRFEVLNQSEDSFEVSFIRLADGADYYPAGTFYLDYVKENGHWVFRDTNFIPVEEKPLQITMAEVQEYHTRVDRRNPELLSFFQAVEEVEVNGENYLIFKAYNQHHAINTTDSHYNYEVSMPYNLQN